QYCGEAVLGAWQLVLLSTHVKGEDAGAVGSERLAALDHYLSANAERATMIFMHHQPIAMGSAWLDGVGLLDAEDFLRVIEHHSHVRAVVWGHVHQALDEQRGNVRFLSTPSTCAQFLPNNEFFALDDKPPGCRWIVLHADGRIDTTVDWLGT
nr:phosphodiesterase [Gammaproteobacteria bacterium]